MMTYIIQTMNDIPYEYDPYIECVFAEYGDAHNWFLENGYTPFHDRNIKGDLEVRFYLEGGDEYTPIDKIGKIIEKELIGGD